MKNAYWLPLGAAFAIAAASPAAAAPTLDQFNPDNTYGNTVATALGQSFTAGLNGQLSSVQLLAGLAFIDPASGSYTVSLFKGDSISAADLLGSISNTGTNANSLLSFDVSSLAVQVAAGSLYTFYVTASGNASIFANFNGSGYANGQLWVDGRHAGGDFQFRTYVDPAIVALPAAVPEPAAWGMMILGMGAIGFAMRRQKVATRVSYAA